MKKTLTLTVLILFAILSFSQTLVNQTVLDTFPAPVSVYQYFKALPDSAGGLVIVSDFYPAGGFGQGNQVVGLDASGNYIGAFDFTHLNSGINAGSNICVKGNYAYAVSFTTDSAVNTGTRCNLMKINISTMDTVWTISQVIDSAVQQAPFSVLADDSGYVYMGASVQTATDYKIAVIKYDRNGNEIWESSYDTAGLYTLPVAMALSGGGNAIAVTGFSFDGLGNSNFVTADFTASTGHMYGYKTSGNGTGAISHPVGITTDIAGNSYIAGTSTVAGTSSVFKLIMYDSAFDQIWVSTWGDSSAPNTAASLAMDQPYPTGHLLVTGTSPNTSGGTDMVTQEYSAATGTLVWSSRLSAPHPDYAMTGIGVTNDGNGNTYTTGSVYSGTDTNIVTAAYDTSGHLLWMKTYARTLGSTDVPYSILMNGDNTSPVVTARSADATNSLYLMLEYDVYKANIAPDSTAPQQQWAYYENKGQLTDTGTHQANYLSYYTNTANPRMYVSNGALSYVYSRIDSSIDTLQRIDLILEQSKAGNPVNSSIEYYPSEQIAPYLNYYIGGLPSFYEDVHGYQRITAADVYPNIDWQLYSDSGGLKYYYVVNPGGTPNDIQFGYAGADSITVDSVSGLHIYSRYGVVNQYPFTAWQYSGGTATQISLTLSPLDSADFYFTTGTYDNTQPLYITMEQQQSLQGNSPIENLTWSTYLGGSGYQSGTSMDVDDVGNQFICVSTLSTTYPTANSQTITTTNANNIVVSKFDATNVLQWSTYYGGNISCLYGFHLGGISVGTASDLPDQPVYVGGTICSTGTPLPSDPSLTSPYHMTSYQGGNSDMFLVRFNGITGLLTHGTLIGSSETDGISSIKVDRSNNFLYLGGYTQSTNSSAIQFPYTNTYTSNFYDDQGKGILMQFDNELNLEWATGIGSSTLVTISGSSGVAGCVVGDIAIDASENLLLSGYSVASFPTSSPYNISPPSTSSYHQSHVGITSSGHAVPYNAFLMKFEPLPGNTNAYSLYYFSEYGPQETNYAGPINADASGNIYIGGTLFGTTDLSFINPGSDAMYINSFASDQTEDGYIAMFDPNGVPIWSTLLGGASSVGGIDVDNNSDLLVYSQTGDVTSPTVKQETNYYFDNVFPSSTTNAKAYIFGFTPQHQAGWITYFGGTSGQTIGNAILYQNTNYYICGATQSDQSSSIALDNYPLCTNGTSYTQSYGGSQQAYIALFTLDGISTSINEVTPNRKEGVQVYPVPNNGDFTITFPNNLQQRALVSITDDLGQKRYENYTFADHLTISIKLDDGIYFVEVKVGGDNFSSKFIVIN